MTAEMKRRRKLLTDALRSGDYDQCKSYLRDNGGFCCLGVACDVFAKETGRGRWVGLEDLGWHFQIGEQTRSRRLPDKVMGWYGFADNSVAYPDPDDKLTILDLANWNDDGKDFPWIADLIDSEPEGMFVS